MNLVLDIGNTFYKVYIFRDDTICYKDSSVSLSGDQIVSLVKQYNIRSAIISTTRHRDIVLEGHLRSHIGEVIYFDPAETLVPISNSYQTPQTLGSDRLAAAVEAASRFPDRHVMIMDFGTALTIDFVSADGVFRGGNISLGLSSRFDALHRLTARLPLLRPQEHAIGRVGTSTKTAIEYGVMQSMWYEIEGYLSQNSDKIAIFTGGEAIFFEKLLKNTIFADYELVPKGLNRILRYNVEKYQI